jgi:hypothetical protein
MWKRPGDGPIQPFDAADPVDLFVISTRADGKVGHFVFPRDVLCQRDIVSRSGVGGKRGFRVYPPWVTTTSRQAAITQAWQLTHFLAIEPAIDIARSRAHHRRPVSGP